MSGEDKPIFVNKDEFLNYLCEEVIDMVEENPKTSFEHIYNVAVCDVEQMLRTNFDKDPHKDIIISLNEKEMSK